MSIESPMVSTDVREAFTSRMRKKAISVTAMVDEYEAKLADGSFEDADGKPVGEGEDRKGAMQRSIEASVERVEEMRRVLESGEDISRTTSTVEAEYVYTDPKTKKVEKRETISLDIEQKCQEFINFYATTSVDVPVDFTEQVQDIWERNREDIQKAIEEKGFDDVLIVPAGLFLADLSKKMKMENGYADYISKSGTTTADLSGVPVVSLGTDKVRIILIHKAQNLADRPELAVTKGKKAQDLDQEASLTLEDYLIFQRKYSLENGGKHLDEDGWTWLPRSKSGTRFVYGQWNPGRGKLVVDASDAGSSSPSCGCRPSRYFI